MAIILELLTKKPPGSKDRFAKKQYWLYGSHNLRPWLLDWWPRPTLELKFGWVQVGENFYRRSLGPELGDFILSLGQVDPKQPVTSWYVMSTKHRFVLPLNSISAVVDGDKGARELSDSSWATILSWANFAVDKTLADGLLSRRTVNPSRWKSLIRKAYAPGCAWADLTTNGRLRFVLTRRAVPVDSASPLIAEHADKLPMQLDSDMLKACVPQPPLNNPSSSAMLNAGLFEALCGMPADSFMPNWVCLDCDAKGDKPVVLDIAGLPFSMQADKIGPSPFFRSPRGFPNQTFEPKDFVMPSLAAEAMAQIYGELILGDPTFLKASEHTDSSFHEKDAAVTRRALDVED